MKSRSIATRSPRDRLLEGSTDLEAALSGTGEEGDPDSPLNFRRSEGHPASLDRCGTFDVDSDAIHVGPRDREQIAAPLREAVDEVRVLVAELVTHRLPADRQADTFRWGSAFGSDRYHP